MTEEDQELRTAIATIRELAFDIGKGDMLCSNVECLRVATMKVFWPVLPGEDYPHYCEPCAAWAGKILEACGVKASCEKLPGRVLPMRSRDVTLED